MRGIQLWNNAVSAWTGYGNPGSGLGGALFAVHITENTNGNNLQMPTALPIVTGCGVAFDSSYAAEAGSADTDNVDTFGTSRAALTDPCAPEITLLGTNGAEIPAGDDTPSAADGTAFGTVAVGQSAGPRTFSIRNDGDNPLAVTAITRDGGGAGAFQLTLPTLPLSLDPGAGTTFDLSFAPGAAATYRATLRIANDDTDENPYTFDVEGSGGEPDIAVAAGRDLGDVAAGGSAVGSLAIANTGNLPLTLTGFGTTAPSAGRQTLQGAAGLAERFVYTAPGQANGIIKTFTPGQDVLDVSALLAAIPYTGTDPFADGTLVLTERRGSTYVSLDPDGRAGPKVAVTLTQLQGVPVAGLVRARDIAWGPP